MARDRRTAGAVLGTVLVGLMATGCATVRGPQQSQMRTIGAASVVDLATAGELLLTGGGSPSLRITAGKNVISHLTSDVRGDRLTLGSDGSVRDFGTVRYDLVLPAARVVELSGSGTVQAKSPSALHQLLLPGSGEIRVDGLQAEHLTVNLSGSGLVTVAGSATRQLVSIDGSGRYSADGLASQDAQVTIGGSGSAAVTASRTLTATISGSGTITYRGNAVVRSTVTGSGSVVRR